MTETRMQLEDCEYCQRCQETSMPVPESSLHTLRQPLRLSLRREADKTVIRAR